MGDSWFSARKDADVKADISITDSKYRSEFYFEYQFQRAEGFLASKRAMNIVSFEVRDRLRYGYPLYKLNNGVWETTEVKEKMTLNFNLYVGYKFFPKTEKTQSIGFYFHAYRGLNPYGQLRNYPGYPFFGIAISYEP